MIKSILDTDLYKLTTQQAVLRYFPNVNAEFTFTNRNPNKYKFNDKFLNKFTNRLQGTKFISLQDDEYLWLKNNLSDIFSIEYIELLRNFRFDPNEVTYYLEDGNLQLKIKGPWWRTTLWEVPLMAIISETYFQTVYTDWNYDKVFDINEAKRYALVSIGRPFSEFGTRRRRSYESQRSVISQLNFANNFIGTSNPHFAQQYNLNVVGSHPHEWFMGVSGIEGIRGANNVALDWWANIYDDALRPMFALTDTFTSNVFFSTFSRRHASLYDGLRCDSGHVLEFIRKACKAYSRLNIDPTTKTLLFSDNLNVEQCSKIAEYCKDKIRCCFGIGTNLTNDFHDNLALNMVIKLTEVDGVKVVKLSDEPGKYSGDSEAIKIAKQLLLIS